jgi:hypothetical protein
LPRFINIYSKIRSWYNIKFSGQIKLFLTKIKPSNKFSESLLQARGITLSIAAMALNGLNNDFDPVFSEFTHTLPDSDGKLGHCYTTLSNINLALKQVGEDVNAQCFRVSEDRRHTAEYHNNFQEAGKILESESWKRTKIFRWRVLDEIVRLQKRGFTVRESYVKNTKVVKKNVGQYTDFANYYEKKFFSNQVNKVPKFPIIRS